MLARPKSDTPGTSQPGCDHVAAFDMKMIQSSESRSPWLHVRCYAQGSSAARVKQAAANIHQHVAVLGCLDAVNRRELRDDGVVVAQPAAGVVLKYVRCEVPRGRPHAQVVDDAMQAVLRLSCQRSRGECTPTAIEAQTEAVDWAMTRLK